MFDPHTEQARTRFDLSDRVTNRANDSYGTLKFDSRAKSTAQKYESYRSWNDGGLHFGGEIGGYDESGVCSPPLWKTSVTRSPNHHNHHQQNNNRSLSPAQKSQAVANGQRELMEMIRNMPESSYELSLKDLIEPPRNMEHPMIEKRLENTAALEKSIGTSAHLYRGKEAERRKVNNTPKKSDKKGQIKRNESFDNGRFLLKMGFPVSWGSRNKKKSNSAAAAAMNSTCSKVSPRPSVDGSGTGKSVDKEWWKKKRLSDSRDSQSGSLSSNSSGSSSSTGSSTRHGRSCTPSCWSIFRTRKGKTHNIESYLF